MILVGIRFRIIQLIISDHQFFSQLIFLFVWNLCRLQTFCMLISQLELVSVIVQMNVTFVMMKRVSVMIYMIFCRYSSFFNTNVLKFIDDGFFGFLFLCQQFFKEHKEYAMNDFYITGESYAGHYIPAFASRVHQGNKAEEGIHINLKACKTFFPFFGFTLSCLINVNYSGICNWKWTYKSRNSVQSLHWLCIGNGHYSRIWLQRNQQDLSCLSTCNQTLR